MIYDFLKERLKSLTLFSLSLFFISGCGPEITTLKQYSEEQEIIKRQVTDAKNKFESLVKDIKENKLQEDILRRKFVRIYGEPVIVNQIEETGVSELLYRDPIKFFDTPKIYVYFDKEDRLVRWVCEEPRQK